MRNPALFALAEPALLDDCSRPTTSRSATSRADRLRRRRSAVPATRGRAAQAPESRKRTWSQRSAPARRFQALGVDKPYHVIPQGISLSSVNAEQVAEAAARRGSGRDRRRLDGGVPAQRAKTAAVTRRSTTSITCSSSGTRSTRGCRAAGSGSSARRATGSGAASQAATTSSSSAGCRVSRHSRTQRTSTSPSIRGRRTRGSRLRRSPSTWARRSDRLVRLRGDREPARDRRGRPGLDAAGVRRRGRRAWRTTSRRGASSRRRRRAGAALDWDVLARRYEDEILDRYLPR